MKNEPTARATMDAQEVLDAFAYLDTWEERFELIADLGRQLAPLVDAERTDANLVPGCTTRTWLTGSKRSDSPYLELMADAETPLVRGLVALLLMPFRQKTPAEVLETDPRAFIAQLQLDQALSAKRRAGMEAFLERVRRIAREHSR
jgi:cysteine desulfuration protein SufE